MFHRVKRSFFHAISPLPSLVVILPCTWKQFLFFYIYFIVTFSSVKNSSSWLASRLGKFPSETFICFSLGIGRREHASEACVQLLIAVVWFCLAALI
jgi:hypothetical protein